LPSINPRDYKDIPGFPTSDVELQMVSVSRYFWSF
jgi:hypothetical protein